MGRVAVRREGTGPEVLLVHGGASPATTWSGLEGLTRRWTLMLMHRRGYPPSPPPAEGQDFEVDASDVEGLLGDRPHLIAHSYGSLGALIAATRRPSRVRSLTIIEPPLFLWEGDPEIEHLRGLGDAVLLDGLDAEPRVLREFLQLAGSPSLDDGPLPAAVASGVRRAHGARLPGEARPSLEVLRDAGIPSLVASGGHTPGLERIRDHLAEALDGERLLALGGGHFVPRAPGFAEQLEAFLSRC